jgi:hypothetical protein
MKKISIMADYGMSPYAWIKDESDDTPYVGINCGGYLNKPSEFPMPDQLHDQFIEWCGGFEQGADKPDFDWASFHAQGLNLSRQLKLSVGDEFKVVYVKPVEDSSDTSYTEIK